MGFKMKYEIKYEYIDNPLNRRRIIEPKRVFGVAHDTGNKNSTARNNVNYFNRKYKVVGGINYEIANDAKGKLVPFRVASAQSFTDDKEIIVCIPLNERAYHVLYDIPLDNHIFGIDANNGAIGHELCFFDDVNRTKKAYDKFVWLWAYTFYLYKWKISDVKRLLVGHDFLDPKRKVDPMSAFKIIGKSYDNFLDDVIKEYKECTLEEEIKKVVMSIMSKYFNDIPKDMESWVAEPADRMYEKGVFKGRGNNKLDPKDNVTRAELVVVADRIVEYLLKELKK